MMKKSRWMFESTEMILLMNTGILSSCSLTLQSLFSFLFSLFCCAHRPTGSALFVVRATANPLAEIMTFFSIISFLPRASSLLFSLCLTFSSLFFIFLFSLFTKYARFRFVVTKPPFLPPLALDSFSL